MKKGISALVLILLFSTLGLVLTILYFQLNTLKIANSNKQSSSSPNVDKASQNNETKKSLLDDISVTDIDYQGFSNELKNVFAGKTIFTQKEGGVDYYTYGSDGYWGMYVYKYVPGKSVIPSQYEGMTWTRDLKEEVNHYKTLKLGEQQAYYGFGVGGATLVNTDLREIGSKRYAIVDIPFPPSATLGHCYYLYDSKNSQIIYIYINFYDTEEIFDFNPNRKETSKIKYPAKDQTLLDTFEQNVLMKN